MARDDPGTGRSDGRDRPPVPARADAAERPATAPDDEGDGTGPERETTVPARRRDAAGRFAGRRAKRTTRPPRSRIGRSRSHNGSSCHLELVRVLVVLEHQVGRLEAETNGRTWVDFTARDRANMLGIRRLQSAGVEARRKALSAAIRHFARERVIPGHRELAARAACELGAPFPWRNLYRPPYDTMWREAGDRPADLTPITKDRSRMSRRELVHHIRRQTGRRDDLLEARRAALLLESTAEGWEPILDHPRAERPAPPAPPAMLIHF